MRPFSASIVKLDYIVVNVLLLSILGKLDAKLTSTSFLHPISCKVRITHAFIA